MSVQPRLARYQGFCHEALFYAGPDQLVTNLDRFVREGLQADEKVLVILGSSKLRSLRTALGRDAAKVRFADMDDVGVNPARIIPFWNEFVDDLGPGQSARGVGEPVTPARHSAELAECQLHESLLNVAFTDAPPFWLLCPYDTAELDPAVLDEARTSHTSIRSPIQSSVASEQYKQVRPLGAFSGRDLKDAPAVAVRLDVNEQNVGSLRRMMREQARDFGLHEPAVGDFALAVHEVIVNSLKHGGGHGQVCLWSEGKTLICEVRDNGHFDEPLAGRKRPIKTSKSGRGLWMANQLCDLVQIRNVSTGTIVRLHKRLRTHH